MRRHESVKAGHLDRYRPVQKVPGIQLSPDHARHDALFFRSCELAHAEVPSGGIGVRQLVVQRVGG
jgi:hypothetical protein